jgi:hypothetical protein
MHQAGVAPNWARRTIDCRHQPAWPVVETPPLVIPPLVSSYYLQSYKSSRQLLTRRAKCQPRLPIIKTPLVSIQLVSPTFQRRGLQERLTPWSIGETMRVKQMGRCLRVIENDKRLDYMMLWSHNYANIDMDSWRI